MNEQRYLWIEQYLIITLETINTFLTSQFFNQSYNEKAYDIKWTNATVYL